MKKSNRKSRREKKKGGGEGEGKKSVVHDDGMSIIKLVKKLYKLICKYLFLDLNYWAAYAGLLGIWGS